MNLASFFTLSYWNGLARAHLSTLVMVLAAVIVVLLDQPVRHTVREISKPYHRFVKFLIFTAVCSFGYAAITVGCAALIKAVLSMHKGAFMAPLAIAIFIVSGVIAERQRHI